MSGNGYEIKYKSNATWISPSDKEPVTDYAYSFAVVGDTQKVNIKHPENFDVIYDWILDNVESKKMKFVFGLGDITDESSPDEWARAKESIHSMDGKVDYSIVRGNHDTVIGFNSTFPWSDYKDTFEGGKLGATMLNTWRTLTLGDHKYLLITLDFGPSDAILDWASELCEEYPDHKVIITTHAYLYSNGTPIDADDHCAMKDNGGYNNGDDMWDKLISKHENILLVISGHEACDRIVVAQNEGENGNVVTQMLVNPQLLDLNATGGLGLVAMLYFSEDGRNVTVEYYSTIKNKFYRDINQFSFSLYPNDEAPETSTQETTAEVTTTETSTAEVTTEVITLSEVTTAEVTTEVVTSDEVTSEEEIVSSEVVDSDNTEKSGCGSSISRQASAIIIVILGAALIITRKKYD